MSVVATLVAAELVEQIVKLAVIRSLAKPRRETTSSAGVVPFIHSSGESIMAAKNQTPSSAQVEELMARLVAARGVKRAGTLVERLANMAADSGRAAARIGAGFAAAGENMGLAFDLERDRQTRRTAQHLLGQV